MTLWIQYLFLSAELNAKENELEAMKEHAESTNREYDRLLSEFQELQVS